MSPIKKLRHHSSHRNPGALKHSNLARSPAKVTERINSGDPASLALLSRQLRTKKSIIVLSGAGISTNAGSMSTHPVLTNVQDSS